MKIFIETPWGERATQTVEEIQSASEKSDVIEIRQQLDEDVDVIVVVGGDSAMLRAIKRHRDKNIPFYGINRGHVGFLLNELNFLPAKLAESIARSKSIDLWSIEATATWLDESTTTFYGFNDVYVNPLEGQALKMKLSINGEQLDSEIVGDGIIVSTPQGSTGYNRTAGGVIVSPSSEIIQLTPKLCTIGKNRELATTFVEQFDTEFRIDFIDSDERPGAVFADGLDHSHDHFESVEALTFKRTERNTTLLFDSSKGFYDKVFNVKYRK